MLILILLPAAFLLPPRAGAGEIIGGREARPHSRLYMAYLEIQSGKKNCGGFLVSENVVLTAAHCNGDEITVTLGAHDINEEERSQQVIPVDVKIPHPQYDRETRNNDIMLLQLSHNVKVSNNVRQINLPWARQSVPAGTPCSVAGWGRTSLTNTTDTLREVNLTVMSDQTCKSRYRHYYNASSMLCAGEPREKKTFYLGNSGGPLVCGGVAEGIVSYCLKNSIAPPGVYTRISPFMPWITRTVRRI